MDQILFTSPIVLATSVALNVYFGVLLLTMLDANGRGAAVFMWKVPAALALLVAAIVLAQVL